MARTKSTSLPQGGLVAVLTGDLIGSSRIPPRRRGQLYGIVDAALSPRRLRKVLNGGRVLGRQTFRGDAFQVLIDRPQGGLAAALYIIADLRSQQEKLGVPLGARIAVGIGTTDFVSGGPSRVPWDRAEVKDAKARRAREPDPFRGDGEAFRRSGLGLDRMKKNRLITMRTPWPEVDAELDVGCRFLDGLVGEMSDIQAAALRGILEGMTQREVARAEGKSQSAIAQRLRRVNWVAVGSLLARFVVLMDRLSGQPAGPAR